MVDRSRVLNYFQNKRIQWISQDKSVEKHISRLGKEGLAQEFTKDRPEFSQVCEYVRYLSSIQVTKPPEKIEDLLGLVFGIPLDPTINIMLGAIDIACGYSKTGETLLKVGIGAIAVLGLAYLLNEIFRKQ